MLTIATSETATTDAVLEHSRLLVAQNIRHLPDLPGVPAEIVEQVQQLILLIDATKRVAEVVRDNTFEGFPLPYRVRNSIIRELHNTSLIFGDSITKEHWSR